MDESLPCPVCGGRAWAHYDPTTIRIHCPCCDILGPEKDTIDEARAAWNALPRSLAWTDEPPKQDGWYFMQVRLPGKPVRVVHVHRVPMMPKRASSGMLCVSQIQQDEPPGTPLCEIDPTHRFWAGPIPEPREPK